MSDWEFYWETVKNTGLVRLVLSWFRLLGTLSVGGLLGRLGDQSEDLESSSPSYKRAY